MDVRYYSLIRSTREGELVGWVPDLPGVTASGVAEDEVVGQLSRHALELLHRIVAKGLPIPVPSPADAFPLGDHMGPYRRLPLVLG
jgi:predicted RNase H-like HicB family nuclease